MYMKNLLLPFAFVIAFACGSFAQTKPTPTPKTISGGILNGKAVSLPKPEYPADARRARTSGTVSVQVLIDETGMVISAKVVSGTEMASLRQASEAAAMKATFSPTLLSGQPVKVSGVITYKFVAETNEERLKVMAVAAFLRMARQFTNDWGMLNKVFETEDFFKEGAAFVPEYANEFKGLTNAGGMTPKKRAEAIDEALSSIRSKLDASGQWQYDAGLELADAFGSLMRIVGPDGQPDLSKIDEPGLKVTLGRIADLTLSAPADFPPDVLEKLKEFAALRSKGIFTSEASLQQFMNRMEALLNTISPEDGK
jgi:TonB family protein